MNKYIYKINDEFTSIIRRIENNPFSNWETVLTISPRFFLDGRERIQFLEESLELCKKTMM